MKRKRERTNEARRRTKREGERSHLTGFQNLLGLAAYCLTLSASVPINIKQTRVCSTKLPASSRQAGRQAGGKARRRQICRKQTLRTALQFPEGTHPQKLTAQVAFVIYSLSSPSPLVTKSFCLSFSKGRVPQSLAPSITMLRGTNPKDLNSYSKNRPQE